MSPRLIEPSRDPVRPQPTTQVSIEFDGRRLDGVLGQSIAGVLLGNGIESWRTTPLGGEPRGVFCGIGVCFDCVLVVNGRRDVRACQQRAADGDVVERQVDAVPDRRGQ